MQLGLESASVLLAAALMVAALTLALVAALAAHRWRVEAEARETLGAERRVGPLEQRAQMAIEGCSVPLTAREFMAVELATTVAPAMIALALNAPLPAVAGVAALGFGAPWVLLSSSKKKGQRQFAEDLGSVLPLVASNLRGGLSLRQALGPVAENMEEPIKGEFAILARELDQGVTIERALAHMAERNDNQDLVLLASAVATQSVTGGNLADVIETVGETIRVRTQLRREVMSKTSQQRATAKVLCVAPVLMGVAMVMLQETYRTFYSQPSGWAILAICALLEFVGYAICSKMTDIKVD